MRRNNDIRVVGREGIEPPQSKTADLQSAELTTCSTYPRCGIDVSHMLLADPAGGVYRSALPLSNMGRGTCASCPLSRDLRKYVPKKVVRVESDPASQAAEPTWEPTPEAKQQATRLRIIAVVLWMVGIAREAFAIFWVLKQSAVSLVLLIVAISDVVLR